MDFIAIGDTTVDEFIRLKDTKAQINCDSTGENCKISMAWGDKIPYDFSVLVPGVGNAANAAVTAARLGLSSGFVSNVGKDRYGDEIIASFTRENVDTKYIAVNDGIPTNHHFVLWYGAERTILIRHEAYPYIIPKEFTSPRWVYLSSIGEHTETFYNELVQWLNEHSETKLAFQPGTFQMEIGKEKLAPLYARTELVACNKEEAERILEIGLLAGKAGETDIKILLEKMHQLGPKIVLITDGTNGAYASDGEKMLKVSMYPDLKPPLDRTGAGDASSSSVVVALALGKSLDEALLWGPINAASVVQEIGAQKGLLTRDVLEQRIKDAPSTYTVTSL
ncbi:MAG: carbohydrate kinase family protein [bacterium]